ncbi:hypothetical protein [Brevundimonas lutea]|uniref:hypothetical protein n=1 Tax=Brevundimonas lutea TaxID=2293980 RepID=UPI000F03E5E1|nr:hypothetical protein [Brevundimonas lutea]
MDVSIWTGLAALVVFAAGYLLGRSQSRGEPSRMGRRRRRDRADNTVVRRPQPKRESNQTYGYIKPATDQNAEVKALLAEGKTLEAVKALRRANPEMTLEAATRAVRAYLTPR